MSGEELSSFPVGKRVDETERGVRGAVDGWHHDRDGRTGDGEGLPPDVTGWSVAGREKRS